MQELRLVAVSEDGSYLVLATAGRGTRFTLPIDDRLRAVVRGHFSRLGQYEIEVESPLRPKEIQARIRAGETAEEIAETAGIPVERVRWFEGPVLQEREYMAQQAQRVTIRRPGESSPGPALGEIVEERLGKRGIDLEEVEWDSRKCEDSTWRVSLVFCYDGRPYAAEWSYDPRRRHITAVNDEAARLSSLDLDETVDDTVTPFLPRRAMKVVVDQPREEPPAPPAPAPLRKEPPSAEPSLVREPPSGARPREGVPPREATALREAPGPRDATAPREAAGPREEIGGPRPGSGTGVADRPPAGPRPAAAPAADTPAADRPEPAAERPAADRDPAAVHVPAPEQAEEPALERTAAEAAAARREETRPAAATPAASKPAAAGPATPKPAPPRHPAAQRKPADRGPGPAEQPAETVAERPAAAAAGGAKPAAPPAAQEKRPARKKARGRRASVPSWDEIMFGARRPE